MTEAVKRTRTMITVDTRPAMPRHIKLRHDAGRGRWILLAPERLFDPDDTAVSVLKLCDGKNSVADIVGGVGLLLGVVGSLPPALDCSGVYSLDMNAFASGTLGGAPILALHVPGALVYCQWWGRDPGFPAPLNTTLSDALYYWVEP